MSPGAFVSSYTLFLQTPMVRTRYATTLLLLLLAGVMARPSNAQGPAPASCVLGTAEANLDVNNVFAKVFNTGSLFFGNTTDDGSGYLVPKASEKSPIFASGLWVGGKVGGKVRVAGSRYSGFNFWPGPLDSATGRPVNPASCDAYDRIYSVTRTDIANFAAGNGATLDLAEWPVDLGAPVVDGDGVDGNYNLDGGDRPDIIGDQGVFWVMNDVGGPHTLQQSDPLGIEVQVLAFSFSRADALGSTTFYRYRVINKGPTPIEQTYLSIFSDVDLGDAGDDYVGYDVDLGLGFAYNSDDSDVGGLNGGYGAVPPAIGYDFFQGPIVNGDTLAATAFSYFQNVNNPAVGDPSTAERIYFYQQGLWGDGTPMRANGDGYDELSSFPITKFAFPGDPVTKEYWSEVNNDGALKTNGAGDRRFVIHTGPFTLQRNDPQDIVFGIVFAQGADRFSSITALRAADRLAQTAYDNGFRLAPPPPAPPLCVRGNANLAPGSGNCLESVSLDGQATLVWGYPASSSNYLGQFEVTDVLLDADVVDDSTYNFEGFNIYRYPTADFDESSRQLVATYDIVNGVTRVIDQVFSSALGDLAPTVVARGTDSGIQYSYRLPNLTNYTDYYYGVSAYSFNEESTPKVIESSPSKIVVRPAGLTSGRKTQSAFGDGFVGVTTNAIGAGVIGASVVDPTAITGNSYEVRFYNPKDKDGNIVGGAVTYNIVNATTGDVIVDGQAAYARTGRVLPQGENVVVAQGLSFTIQGPEPGFDSFQVIRNAAGPIVPPTGGSADFAGFPVPKRPGAEQQVGPAIWFFSTGGRGTFEEWLGRVVRGDNGDRLFPYDFEMRWSGTSIGAKDGIFGQEGANPTLPFELWNTGIGTPNNAADDYKMIPIFLDIDNDGTYNLSALDSPISGAANDPETDWIYWYEPADKSPGTAGYDAYANGGTPDFSQIGDEVMARTTLVGWNLGTAPPYPQALPEQGTIFRIVTLKPNQPGDVYSLNTDGSQLIDGSAEDAVAALESINVVPNPYLGASTYESGNLSRVARFTNLPEQASTIRIYTVAGTLIKTLRKEGPSRSLDWDLTTENDLPVASGMYLIHINIEGVGERTLKFGVVQRRTQITVF